jgi:hypothetical protein
MKKRLTVLLTSFVIVGIFSTALTLVRAQSSATPSNPSAVDTTVPKQKQAKAVERHPAIRRAITALEAAKVDLERADHDFGGHRKQALVDCDKAIQQLRLALQFDKN